MTATTATKSLADKVIDKVTSAMAKAAEAVSKLVDKFVHYFSTHSPAILVVGPAVLGAAITAFFGAAGYAAAYGIGLVLGYVVFPLFVLYAEATQLDGMTALYFTLIITFASIAAIVGAQAAMLIIAIL